MPASATWHILRPDCRTVQVSLSRTGWDPTLCTGPHHSGLPRMTLLCSSSRVILAPKMGSLPRSAVTREGRRNQDPADLAGGVASR